VVISVNRSFARNRFLAEVAVEGRAVSKYLGRAQDYHEAIHRILLKEWDPIGVADVPEAQDEYDQYINQVYGMLIRHEPKHKLRDFLWWAVTKNMGLIGNRRHTEQIVEHLLSVREEMQARGHEEPRAKPLSSLDVMAFVATKEPAQARQFYEGVLGLRLVADEQFALVFDANGTMLRVAKVQELTPARHTVLGWVVPDIAGAITELGRKGVTFERYRGLKQDELGICTFPNGAKVAWFKDTDGNTLSLTQF
jgi:catechol 2,3-dioxygenase-like lactoylglutathione lyase family enzyme